jgi:hypothetical protein
MINAGVDYILQRLDTGSRVRILNCLFIQSLRNFRAKCTTYSPKSFSPIETAMRAGLVDILWFPLHVSGNHWTLLKINLITRTIAYSDSLGGTIPSDELALIRWWLKSVLGSPAEFRVIAPDFPSPRQADSYSCGIIVLSILGFVLLNFDLWSPEKAESERMQWFLRLSQPFAEFEDLVSVFYFPQVRGPKH